MDFPNWHNYNLPHCGPQDPQQMTEQRTQRRLAAILAADVVGYSRLMQADEAGTLARLKNRRS
jgi:class 3 adenylate cyclase